jgi:nicotinamide mononucleotide transporter
MIEPVELAGFALSLAMVYCNIKEIHWGWPLAIFSSLLYGVVFWNSQLYGEASLQVMFVLTSLWGWRQWRKLQQRRQVPIDEINLEQGLTHSQAKLSISTLQPSELQKAVVVTLFIWPALTYFLHRYTDSDVAAWDGLVTALSLLAQYLLAKKKIENWWVWLIVNVITVGLMMAKSLWLTSLLYALFAVLSYVGLKAWQQKHD